MIRQPFVDGAPIWLDLSVDAADIDRSVAFYRDVFGWEHTSLGAEAGGYGLFTLGGRTVAAIGPKPADLPAAWSIYFQTPDADATAATVQQAGGSVLEAPMDVFTSGRLAHFRDPSGARFAVWQPGDNKGLDRVMADGSLCWTELHTSDQQAVRRFYGTVFGWTFNEVPSPAGPYVIVTPRGGSTEGGDEQGGIAGLVPGIDQSAWAHYIAVEDADTVAAAITKGGGTVLMGPEDVPEIGRIAFVRDVNGADFAIIKPAPMG